MSDMLAPGARAVRDGLEADADTGADAVAPATFPHLGPGDAPGPMAPLDVLNDVDVTVTVELGRVRLRVRDLLALREGSVVELDTTAGAPVDVLVNGTPVARGEVVVVGDELGVRVTQMLRRA